MGSLESGLEKKCCLSPTRRNRLGTKGRTTFQVPERVRQNIHRLKGLNEADFHRLRKSPNGSREDVSPFLCKN